jgi:hypothetical protein
MQVVISVYRSRYFILWTYRTTCLQSVFNDFWQSDLSQNATELVGTCAVHHLQTLRQHYHDLIHESEKFKLKISFTMLKAI